MNKNVYTIAILTARPESTDELIGVLDERVSRNTASSRMPSAQTSSCPTNAGTTLTPIPNTGGRPIWPRLSSALNHEQDHTHHRCRIRTRQGDRAGPGQERAYGHRRRRELAASHGASGGGSASGAPRDRHHGLAGQSLSVLSMAHSRCQSRMCLLAKPG